MNEPKIFIPVSHNGGGDGKTEWAISLATSFNGRHVQIENMGGSHADRACNNMANRFLKTDCDVMLIVDIDTEFTERDVARALGHIARGVKAVWGLYPKKQDEAPPCINTWPEVALPDEHGLVNVRRAGRGFLMVVREVFEALKIDNGGPAQRFHNHGCIEWAFFRSGTVDGHYSALEQSEDPEGFGLQEWISEDWMFCEDLRFHLEIPTLVDTGIVLSHIGSKTYRFPAQNLVRVDTNISSWRDIHGWFDYEDFYRYLVDNIYDGGNFAEVGCWLGRSVGAFYEIAGKYGKRIGVVAVDTFQGEPAGAEHAEILAAHGGSVEAAFRANMESLGLKPHIVAAKSDEAAMEFANESFDAVFIDASHEEVNALNDIAAWLRKVKIGGIIAGHDYDEPGVHDAVNQWFHPEQIQTMGRCWFVQL